MGRRDPEASFVMLSSRGSPSTTMTMIRNSSAISNELAALWNAKAVSKKLVKNLFNFVEVWQGLTFLASRFMIKTTDRLSGRTQFMYLPAFGSAA
jgi:hypothetical protein